MTAGRFGAGQKPHRTVARPDVTVVLALVRAAIRSGVAIPRALQAAGDALESPGLRRAGTLLLLGAPWDEAWGGTAPGSAEEIVARALEPAWTDGADPIPLLERAAASWQSRRDRRAREAAARLGVRLVLPLGTCYLPAFVLVGVIPIVLATGGAVVMP
ncbi:MAG TPA: type II secretion system F family protein [Actinomycetaceae bacterium]|nr:type II secretion system F family protein [Actinomycetaceae bacterium]